MTVLSSYKTTPLLKNIATNLRFSTTIRVVTIQSDGSILIGGDFTNYAVPNRNRLIRLNSNGFIDKTFCTNAVDSNKFSNGVVTSITIQSDGKILVGGSFTDYAGTSGRSRLIRLNSDGTLDTAFCANASDGIKFAATITSIAVQSDGKILVGGGFTSYAGTAGRNYLVRLNADGTTDTAFCANAVDSFKIGNSISSIAVQSDGKILIGGDFTNYAGTVGRNNLVRLNADGTTDTVFCTNAVDGPKFGGGSINSIIVQIDGKILVGGSFINYVITNRNCLVRLNTDGTLDTTFCNNAVDGTKFNNTINSIALQSDGKILIGGAFTAYAATTNRNRLVRLNSDGTLDTAFCTNASDGTKFTANINSMAVQSDGKILVGGLFTSYASVLGRSFLIRLNSDGTTDTAFCANAVDVGNRFSNGVVTSITIQSDGKILVGGSFTDYGIVNNNSLIRLNADGTSDSVFLGNILSKIGAGQVVNSIAVQSDGKILVGGAFTAYAGTVGRNRLVRLNADGTTDTAFCTNAVDSNKFSVGVVTSITIQSDGKILVGGSFTAYAGTSGRSRLIRLNSDGTLDTAFCANAVDSNKFSGNIINSITIQSDGKILVGGGFTDYAGTSGRSRLIRLNSDGTLDTTFCNNAVDSNKFSNGVVTSITIQSDGKILVGGSFINYVITNRNCLVRLNTDGTLDTTFCNNAVDGTKFNSSINSITIQSDGKILVGGPFTDYAGTSGRSRLIRLNSDGTLDTTFCNNAVDGTKFNNTINSIALQSDGKMLISGSFTSSASTISNTLYFDRLKYIRDDGISR